MPLDNHENIIKQWRQAKQTGRPYAGGSMASTHPKSQAGHIDLKQDADRSFVIRPATNDLFVRTGKAAPAQLVCARENPGRRWIWSACTPAFSATGRWARTRG
jgi:hypothetical protein